MPQLTEAQSKARPPALGTITAKSGRRNSVIAALTFTGGFSAVRQRLREWLCDGADRSAPSPNWTDVLARFRPAHAVGFCRCGRPAALALAIDPTMLSDRLRVIAVSAACRGCAIPVAD